MEPVLAPNDLRIPISLVRSVTDTSMIFITPIPPTNNDMAATKEINVVITPKILSYWADMSDMLCT